MYPRRRELPHRSTHFPPLGAARWPAALLRASSGSLREYVGALITARDAPHAANGICGMGRVGSAAPPRLAAGPAHRSIAPRTSAKSGWHGIPAIDAPGAARRLFRPGWTRCRRSPALLLPFHYPTGNVDSSLPQQVRLQRDSSLPPAHMTSGTLPPAPVFAKWPFCRPCTQRQMLYSREKLTAQHAPP